MNTVTSEEIAEMKECERCKDRYREYTEDE